MSDGWKPGRGQKIEKLYAWIGTEPDGGEGVVAMRMQDSWLPMVGADRERMESLRKWAQHTANTSGTVIRLKVFGTGTVIDELHPQEPIEKGVAH